MKNKILLNILYINQYNINIYTYTLNTKASNVLIFVNTAQYCKC